MNKREKSYHVLHVNHQFCVVGLLVHQPVAVHDVVTVIHHLVHHSTEVFPLVDPHPVVSPVHGDHTAGPDAVSPSPHVHVVRVLSPPHEVLVSHVVGAVVRHEAAALHPEGVAPAHVGGHVRAVAHALIGTTLEVPVLVEDDLSHHGCCVCSSERCHCYTPH